MSVTEQLNALLPASENGVEVRLQDPQNHDQKHSFRSSKGSLPGSVRAAEIQDLRNMLNNHVVPHCADEETVF